MAVTLRIPTPLRTLTGGAGAVAFNSTAGTAFTLGGFEGARNLTLQNTAAAAVAYFASGEYYRGTDQENYTILLQIPLGIVAFLYGVQKIEDSKPKRQKDEL